MYTSAPLESRRFGIAGTLVAPKVCLLASHLIKVFYLIKPATVCSENKVLPKNLDLTDLVFQSQYRGQHRSSPEAKCQKVP